MYLFKFCFILTGSLVFIGLFILGLIAGLFFYIFKWKTTKNKTHTLFPVCDAYQFFNEFETSLFQKILSSKDRSISSQHLNLLIRQENFPRAELSRIRRGLLKDLNLKIQIIFGISNGICQIDFFEDKHLEIYKLSKKLNVDQLKQMLIDRKLLNKLPVN